MHTDQTGGAVSAGFNFGSTKTVDQCYTVSHDLRWKVGKPPHVIYFAESSSRSVTDLLSTV